MTPRELLLVALGGSAGAAARYAAMEWAPVAPGTFPRTTLMVNVAGAFLLGLLLARFGERPWARLLLGAGLLGGFTTLSTLAVDAATLARDDRVALAAAYVTASVVAGVAAAACGLRAGGWPAGIVAPDEGES